MFGFIVAVAHVERDIMKGFSMNLKYSPIRSGIISRVSGLVSSFRAS